jgi:hypothetical protein
MNKFGGDGSGAVKYFGSETTKRIKFKVIYIVTLRVTVDGVWTGDSIY